MSGAMLAAELNIPSNEERRQMLIKREEQEQERLKVEKERYIQEQERLEQEKEAKKEQMGGLVSQLPIKRAKYINLSDDIKQGGHISLIKNKEQERQLQIK